MVRFSDLALTILISSTTVAYYYVDSFQCSNINTETAQVTINNNSNSRNILHRLSRQPKWKIGRRQLNRSIVSKKSSMITKSLLTSMAGDASSSFNENNKHMVGEAISSVRNAAVDSISNAVKDEPDIEADEIARKQELVQRRKSGKTYKVTLPLAESSATVSSSSSSVAASVLSMGITLYQISKGRKLDPMLELNLDTLDLEGDSTSTMNNDSDSTVDNNIATIDFSYIQRRIGGEFQGLVVSSVKQGSAGWVAGVRPGDILKATSATLGNQMWPKSTLDGVKSALLSRRAVAESIQFEFQRLGETVDNQYELTLTRPIGFNLKEAEDGYVEIIGFTSKASKLVRHAVQVGDRVVAVDSSLGDRMWPVSTVEGVISAVTARLPGQQITFRFERNNAENIIGNYVTTTTASAKGSTVKSQKRLSTISGAAETLPIQSSNNAMLKIGGTSTTSNAAAASLDLELLNRCQEIMKRYKNDEIYVNKFALPGVVADKVVFALASAETRVDSVTLSMILTSYLSCRQPLMAIRVFEAVVGLRADGTNGKVETTISNSKAHNSDTNPLLGKNGKQIVHNIDALDVYAVSALLKAHAMNDDLLSVKTVLSALEGRGGDAMGGIEVASWPGTGTGGSLQPDTLCYNIAISAASNAQTDAGLELALQLFNRLSNPVNAGSNKNRYGKNAARLEKDIVSYNAIIKGLAKYGQYKEAIQTFYQMKETGIKPDKYTYTALAKSVMVDDNDVEELLYDMKEEGVTPDVMTFNTIIRYLCEQKKLSAARKVVNWMEASGVSPDSWTYGFLMKGLLDSDNASAALTLFESACSDRRTVGLTENVFIYTIAMTSAATVGDHVRALELLSRMNSLGIKPNIKTLTALLSACLSAEEPELAVDIYRSIPTPDSYAVMKGLLALSRAGKGDEALTMLSEKGTIAGSIQGKQLNKVYEALFKNSIEAKEYKLARLVLTSLLRKGNIPSKAMYQRIFESLSLTLSKGPVSNNLYSTNGIGKREPLNEQVTEKFKFLLFLVDSLSSRNLPCEGPLYSTILQFGHHLGGLPRKVSALMVSAKAASGLYVNKNMKLIDDERCHKSCLIAGWEDLFLSFEELRSQIEGPSSLPELQVRISNRDLSRVLKAEKNLFFRKRSLV